MNEDIEFDFDHSNISNEEDKHEENHCTPPEIRLIAKNVSDNLVPDCSRVRYEKTFKQFVDWQEKNKTKCFSENIFLAYFSHLSESLGPATLWARYSMLKSMTKIQENIDISNYNQLKAFLKKKNVGYRSKQSETFTATQIEQFLNTAPNKQYLIHKVVTIFGILGGCRANELIKVDVNHITYFQDYMLVTIPETKNKVPRSFTIIKEYYATVKEYQLLRPKNVDTPRFFLKYLNGKCYGQVIGINRFRLLPKEIATFLQLDNPKRYTGHAFRRTSATLLAHANAPSERLMRHCGWKSASIAEKYVADSITYKKTTADMITSLIDVSNLPASTSKSSCQQDDLSNNNFVHEDSVLNDDLVINENSPKRDFPVKNSVISRTFSNQNYVINNDLISENEVIEAGTPNPNKIINFTNCTNNQITINFFNK